MPIVGARARKDLLETVARFAQIKRVKVSVVFDGAAEDFFPDGASYKGVKIFYSHFGSDADARIKNLVENSKERRALIVVTSDNALANFCRLRGAQVVRAPDFRRRLEDARGAEIEKTRLNGVKSEELADWMRYFGVDETD